MQAAEFCLKNEIYSAPKGSGSSLSLLPLSFSTLWSAGREAVGRVFPPYFVRTFAEFPTSAEPHHIHQLSRRLFPTSVFMLERSEEAKEQISALKSERVASKEHLYTSPDLQPNHISQCHWRSAFHKETCVGVSTGVPRFPEALSSKPAFCGIQDTQTENLFQLPRCWFMT